MTIFLSNHKILIIIILWHYIHKYYIFKKLLYAFCFYFYALNFINFYHFKFINNKANSFKFTQFNIAILKKYCYNYILRPYNFYYYYLKYKNYFWQQLAKILGLLPRALAVRGLGV